MPSVKQVLQNLFISKIELRHEESEDIIPFTHHRNIDKIVVPLNDDLVKVRDKLLSVQVKQSLCPAFSLDFSFAGGLCEEAGCSKRCEERAQSFQLHKVCFSQL